MKILNANENFTRRIAFMQGMKLRVTFVRLTLFDTSGTLRIKLVGNDKHSMAIGVLTLHLHLPGCSSLKEKRSTIKPVLTRLHREFNVATSEMDLHDVWQSTVIGCATLSRDSTQNQRLLQQIVNFVEQNWPDLLLVDHHIELI